MVGDKSPALNEGNVVVRIDPCYFRTTEVETLLGGPSKAKESLGWVPEITVHKMCVEMVASYLAQAKQHALLKSMDMQLTKVLNKGLFFIAYIQVYNVPSI